MTHDEQNNSSDTGSKVPMTHDELMARIMELDEFREYTDGLIKQSSALRAVVELHKPFLYPEDDKVYCYNCAESYPCPTIEKIEAELI